MALTNSQIDRYSRQLIAPGFGGHAQERLLAARLLLIASPADCDSVLGYLVGAGVGEIGLRADREPERFVRRIARMRQHNADSKVRVVASQSESGEADLVLALAGDTEELEETRTFFQRADNFDGGTVFARLDCPSRIAVIPRRPPCPRCANGGDLLAPLGARSGIATFIANLATLEAIKLLAGYVAPSDATLIEFSGYASSVRPIDSTLDRDCTCASPPGSR